MVLKEFVNRLFYKVWIVEYFMKEKNLFLVFGFIQVLSLAFIVYIILSSLGTVGLDSRIVLSCVFALFTLAVEYMIYSKR